MLHAGRPHLLPSPAQTAHRRRWDPRRRCDRRCYEEILSLLRENVNESRDARACKAFRGMRLTDTARGRGHCCHPFPCPDAGAVERERCLVAPRLRHAARAACGHSARDVGFRRSLGGHSQEYSDSKYSKIVFMNQHEYCEYYRSLSIMSLSS